SAKPMRRPGKGAVDTRLARATSAANATLVSAPPAAVAWLTRATFGFTQADLAAFNALGADDGTRWNAWVGQEMNPFAISASACEARVAGAAFQTLNLTQAQLWATYHADGSNYSHRMLPIAEVECATLIRQTYSKRQVYEVMVDFWHDHFS